MAEPLVLAVASGDYKRSLEALRDRLATQVDAATARDLAPLARQLAQVLALLRDMPTEEASKTDDLAKRRAERRKTSMADPADVGKQRRPRSS